MSGKKILFLHGFAQSASIFSGKTGGLRKALNKAGYETIYLQGPLKLEGDPHGDTDADVDLYGWWKYGEPVYDISEALKVVTDEVAKHPEGSIVGIVGFSQGAGLAGAISGGYKELLPSLSFAVFFSGFKILVEKYSHYYEPKIEIPSLHVIGELDTVVDEDRSLKLYEYSQDDKKTLLKHQGGHFVPNSKDFVTKVLNWITNATTEAQKPKNDIDDDDLFSAIDNIGKA